MEARPEGQREPGATRRTFVAIELPEPVRRQLARFVGVLQRQWPAGSVKWTRPEGMHLTLRFLGDTGPDQVTGLAEGLGRIARPQPPFDLTLGQLGTFPNAGRPRVVWVGVEDPQGTLGPLQRAVEEVVRSVGLERERQTFAPHLTLGRVKPQAPVPAQWGAEAPVAGFTAVALSLMESHLKATGAEYVRIHEARLGRAAIPTRE